jgi:hypothetical protein
MKKKPSKTSNLPKILVDESVEFDLVRFLRKEGFDTKSASEIYTSFEDREILKIAKKEKRILVTDDKDFGNLIFLQKLPHRGVIFFRVKPGLVKFKIKILKLLLVKFGWKLEKYFLVVDENKIRCRVS